MIIWKNKIYQQYFAKTAIINFDKISDLFGKPEIDSIHDADI